MFFSGDATSRRKVDLSGRSKQQDRQKLLEQARLDRERRQRLKLENQSALQIQKFFRGLRCVGRERSKIRVEWQALYGESGEKASLEVFGSNSNYLTQLLYFVRPARAEDLPCLASACSLLLATLKASGPQALTRGASEQSGRTVVQQHRVQQLALLCLQALHHHRYFLQAELLQPWQPVEPTKEGAGRLFLSTLLALTADATWSASVLRFLANQKLFPMLRALLLLQGHPVLPSASASTATAGPNSVSSVEHVGLLLVMRHLEGPDQQGGGVEGELPLALRFSVQIGSIPFLWERLPSFRQAATSAGLWRHMVDSLGGTTAELEAALPAGVGTGLPSKLCLLGNLLAGSAAALARGPSPTQTAVRFASLAQRLLDSLPSEASRRNGDAMQGAEEGGDADGPAAMKVDAPALEPALERQLAHVADPTMLLHLVRLTIPVKDAAGPSQSPGRLGAVGPRGVEVCQALEEEAVGVGATCSLVHSALAVLPGQRSPMLTRLAWQAQLVPRLWAYIRACHQRHLWPPISIPEPLLADKTVPSGWLAWMLPLAVLCPVYSFMLITTDNEEFYEQQKPLPLVDLPILVDVLREAVWQLLWVAGDKGPGGVTSPLAPANLKQHVSVVAGRLLAQLHDRNCQREFTEPERFHAKEALDETFFAQAELETGRARQMLQEAPFLVPFQGRVRVYTRLLDAVRKQSGQGMPFRGVRITIRRDRIIEDSFAQLHNLTPELWQGTIRVQYVNELGAEEAGVDGGGMLKDFLENITRAVFDVQWGLFKETSDHLLYPNPSSAMVVPDHLQYFEFVGKVLGKAMYEGILVDIHFATFFLSKLRNKHNYLHDLPSLDAELYRSLLFLKNYEGDVADLELSFVVEDNVLGEIVQTELLPGGKDIPVTRGNAIRYVWLVANHHLNTQIQQQSLAFLRGFQELIPSELIAMFSEQELQMLISGSEEGMDLQDLRTHATYSGGYHPEHPVICALWEVLLGLDTDLQHKFLKFVTGCSRGPLLGFRHLEPRFCVHRAAAGAADLEALERLPTSATCMNLLKLPPYPSKEMIREKLIYAITAGAGFDLS